MRRQVFLSSLSHGFCFSNREKPEIEESCKLQLCCLWAVSWWTWCATLLLVSFFWWTWCEVYFLLISERENDVHDFRWQDGHTTCGAQSVLDWKYCFMIKIFKRGPNSERQKIVVHDFRCELHAWLHIGRRGNQTDKNLTRAKLNYWLLNSKSHKEFDICELSYRARVEH